jgi:uncharacterized protein YbaA (DUF1428 family)
MSYVDGFLVRAPTKNLAAYKKMSQDAGKVWMEYGALDYKECAGDDLNPEGMLSTFPKRLGAKKGETIIFSWIVYKNRKHRDEVLKKVMADPRMIPPEKMPFDPAHMLYGGFDVIVDMAPGAAPKRAAKKRAMPKKKAAKKKARR